MSGLLAFTLFHTVLSLIQLVSGIVVVLQLLGPRLSNGWLTTYLGSAVATVVTGFLFPFVKFLPSHAVGILSAILLILAIVARYKYRLAGAWRWVFALSVVISVYFDAFVTVVQAFLKVPSLHALAPAGSEPPFAITQGIVLVIFIVLGVLAARRFHPERTAAA